MPITRVGSNPKYSEGWQRAFGAPSQCGQPASGTAACGQTNAPNADACGGEAKAEGQCQGKKEEKPK